MNPFENFSSSSSSDSDEYKDTRDQLFMSMIATTATLLVSDDDDIEIPRFRGPTLRRERLQAHEKLMSDNFGENPKYTDELFRRRFQLSKRLFTRIVADLEAQYPYFQWRYDHRGVKGFSPQQKCTAALRQLANRITSDALDEYLQIAEKTARDCLNFFCEGIIPMYRSKYLRRPTYNDILQLYEAHAARHGFMGMIGSLDYTHWAWANCLNAWRGQFHRGDHERPTVILQAVASQDLWFWHAFFGCAGSSNDINVLITSPLIRYITEARTPSILFQVNGIDYQHGYYLVDGIYPLWGIFVKVFTCPVDPKRQNFKAAQESACKDVERAFGVLKAWWHILQNPMLSWSPSKLSNVMHACIILHNMTLEDEGRAICRSENYVPEFI